MNACKKEPWTVAFVESVQAGEVFVDVGANVCSYTLIAASRGARVVAVEPFARNIGRLCENLAANNLLGNVLMLLGALGAVPGPQQFHISDMSQGSASHILGDTGPHKPTFHATPVMVWTLDQLLPLCGDVPRYIKIDTDGNEKQVLQGMVGALADANTKGVLLEYRLADEEATREFFGQQGWQQVEKFDQRDGKSMGPIAYGLFQRG